MFDFNRRVKSVMGALAGATGVYARDFRSRMTVVAFHRVNDRLPADDGLTCSSETFAAFCEFFKKYFRVVPFEEQVLGCARGEDMGGTLSITFDDGYLDNIEVAAPILRKYQLPATFFVTTGFIGSKQVPFWDEKLPFQPGWMSWDQVRDLVSQGFAIGCHTDTHIDMGKCDEATVRAELGVSKRKLEDMLGRPIKLFVYPFGGRHQLSTRSLELVKEAGFISCASCFGGSNAPTIDPFAIRRIGIADWFASPHQFGVELLLGKA